MNERISSSQWLVYVSMVYFITGMVDIFVYHFCEIVLLQIAYCVILSLPLFVPSLFRS